VTVPSAHSPFSLRKNSTCIGLVNRHDELPAYVRHIGDAYDRAGSGGPSGCKEAWVIILTSDSYLAGVLVTLHTVRKYAASDRDIVVFVMQGHPEIGTTTYYGVSNATIDHLVRTGVIVQIAEPIACKRKLPAQWEWINGPTTSLYTKMALWALVEYTRIVVVEPDVILLDNSEALFQLEGDFAAQAMRSPKDTKFNFGVFMLKPSKEVFYDMLEWINGTLVSNSTDGAIGHANDYSEQNFAQFYFSSNPHTTWHGSQGRIPYNFVMKHMRYMRDGCKHRARAVHFTGSPKPWQNFHCSVTAKNSFQLYDLWWKEYYEMCSKLSDEERSLSCTLNKPQVASLPAGSKASAAKLSERFEITIERQEPFAEGVRLYGDNGWRKVAVCQFGRDDERIVVDLQNHWKLTSEKTYAQNALQYYRKRLSESTSANAKCD